MFYGLEAIERRFFFFFFFLSYFFSSTIASILPLFPFFLVLVFVFSLLLFCAKRLDLLCAGHRSWHCVNQALISSELASCPSCLDVRRI